MELVKCSECVYRNTCPCGYSYCNAACLAIQKKVKNRLKAPFIVVKNSLTCKR